MTADPTPATGADQGGALTEHPCICTSHLIGMGLSLTDAHRVAEAIAARLADERERIAQAIEALDPIEWALAGQDAGTVAARIAREGGQR
jgi:hypothetical protein